MSNDLVTAISGFLSNGWRFFTEVTIPTTDITIAKLAIALALIPIALGFLGVMINLKFGPEQDYGNPKTTMLTVSDKRHLDVR